MLSFSDVLHFFAHEFAGLSRGRQTFAFVFASPFDCVFCWHNKIVSLLAQPLDVIKNAKTRNPPHELGKQLRGAQFV